MFKRWSFIVLGAASLVLLELIFEGLQYTNPPDWFYPLWMILWILFQLIAILAHLAFDCLMRLLDFPMLVKPTFGEMGLLRVSLLLGADAVEGAGIGWLVYAVKHRVGQNIWWVSWLKLFLIAAGMLLLYVGAAFAVWVCAWSHAGTSSEVSAWCEPSLWLFNPVSRVFEVFR